MRRTLAAILLALAAAAGAAAQTDAAAARTELDAGARLYRSGKFAEAEARFRRALELDPEGKDTRLFIARAVQQQFRPGVTTPENVAAGERAVAAYQEVLAKDPADEDAYKAVVFLYTQMRNEQKVGELVLARANDPAVPNEQRAEAFVLLAGKQWQCSHNITEQPANKKPAEKTAEDDKKAAEPQSAPGTVYTMPADPGEFIRARQCVTEGLMLVEQAAVLDPKSPNAFAYKSNLLREAVKLAQMEDDLGQEAELVRRQQEAQETLETLREEAKSAAAGGQAPTRVTVGADTPQPGAAPKKRVVSGGVLNGKAVSKPQPEYPEIAKAAGAQGVVTVQILFDEEGRVTEAKAISGHPLLQQAAVSAARRARFSPTRLNGQPVMVSGVVTYNFVLQ
jgi:TonB family protein